MKFKTETLFTVNVYKLRTNCVDHPCTHWSLNSIRNMFLVFFRQIAKPFSKWGISMAVLVYEFVALSGQHACRENTTRSTRLIIIVINWGFKGGLVEGKESDHPAYHDFQLTVPIKIWQYINERNILNDEKNEAEINIWWIVWRVTLVSAADFIKAHIFKTMTWFDI